jgi:hypothetical protein
MELAAWGQRWGRDMEMEDLDPGFLAWSMSTRLDADAMPDGTTVIEFEFSNTPHGFNRFWLMKHDGKIEMCLKHPGHAVNIKVMADIRRFIQAWRGVRSMREEIATGCIRLEGPSSMTKQVPDLLLGSALAGVARRQNGTGKAPAGRDGEFEGTTRVTAE